MSNPTSVVTERRLGAFYQEILPYLGGSADAGFTPVGSVIAIMGVTAPANYLACNGQIVNVADYPELANYFEQQFGTKYKFGGSGTTFGIPDLRGEFLRGTGTNSHTGNGDGAAVGVHQNATAIPEFVVSQLGTNMYFRGGASATNSFLDYDSTKTKSDIGTLKNLTVSGTAGTTGDSYSSKTVRPTNTSILWCIATKDIYLNPSMDYSTSEKVVGKWIDGKTLYQKTFVLNDFTVTSTVTYIDVVSKSAINLDTLVSYSGTMRWGVADGNATIPFIMSVATSGTPSIINVDLFYNATTNALMLRHYRNTGSTQVYNPIVTIQYTKTT